MKRKLLIIILSLTLSLIFATPALAQGPAGAKVVLGDNLVLEGEQTLNRDVVVFGGNVSVDASSTINGDLVIFGGNATINGTINGDIGLIGGNINLGDTAVVKGDIGLVGGQANVADGAVVEGRLQGFNQFDYDYDREGGDKEPSPIPAVPPVPSIPNIARGGPGPFQFMGRIVSDIFWNLSLLLILGLITWLVAAFMPAQMITIRDTVTGSAPASFGFGLLTAVMVAISFLLVFTICLAFVPLIAALIAGVAVLLGWIVMGQIIGERLLVASGRSQPDFILSSIVGVAVLTVVTNMPVIGEIPCIGFLLGLIGWIAGLIVCLTGLGAVLLTRFGTRPYPATPYSNPGAPPLSPRRRRTYPAQPDTGLDIAVASEAELKARIEAALAEADKTGAEEEPEEEKPAGDEETPPEKTPDDDANGKPKDNPQSGS